MLGEQLVGLPWQALAGTKAGSQVRQRACLMLSVFLRQTPSSLPTKLGGAAIKQHLSNAGSSSPGKVLAGAGEMHGRSWIHGSIQVQLAVLLAHVILPAAGIHQPFPQPLCYRDRDCIAD